MRALPIALLLTLILALGGGCGKPRKPGGSGDLLPGPDGAPDVLRLSGSPYQMGWWQGHLLRDRILALHEAWEAALFEQLIGKTRSTAGAKGVREALEQYIDLILDQTLLRLSERMRQELDGMASGCGVAVEQLLRLDVLRDALRMKGLPPRLTGAAGLLPRPGGEYEARAYWGGSDVEVLSSQWLLVRREPDGGPVTIVLSWPGSLGAVAGLRADGLSYLCGDGAVGNRKRMGFGGGRPFLVAARQMLEETKSAFDLITESTGTMGHCLLGTSVHRIDGVPRVFALAAFAVYSQSDPEWTLDRAPFLAVGPYDQLESPNAIALRESTGAPDLEPDERWLRLRGHADPLGAAPGGQPSATIEWRAARGSLSITLPDGRHTSLSLARDGEPR